MKPTQEKPDNILYYEGVVRVGQHPFKVAQVVTNLGFALLQGDILHYKSANRDNVVEALTELCSEFKKSKCDVLWYRFGAVFVDSNQWDVLDILGKDPHADKR